MAVRRAAVDAPRARRRHGVGVVIALVVAALGLAACSSSGGDDVVRVYSGRHYDLEPAFEQFADETGISVEFLYGGDAELRERILAEGADTIADVYLTVDAGNLYLAAEQGIFQPLDLPAVDDAIPANLRHPDDLWVGLAQRVRTFVYDPATVDPAELTTYEDLADPRWDGRLCLRRSVDSYTQSLVASLVAADGDEATREVLDGWVANAQIYNNDTAILDNIAAGACEVGVTNHYYLARTLAEDPDFPVALAWANQDGRGAHVNLSGGGVTANAPNPDGARRLIEWLATDGQSALVDGNFEYPANPSVDPVPLLDTFGPYVGDPINANDLGSYNRRAVELLAESGYQ